MCGKLSALSLSLDLYKGVKAEKALLSLQLRRFEVPCIRSKCKKNLCIFADSGRPTPKITRADSGRPGLSTDVNVTLLVDFGQPVTGFGPSGFDIKNGTLIR